MASLGFYTGLLFLFWLQCWITVTRRHTKGVLSMSLLFCGEMYSPGAHTHRTRAVLSVDVHKALSDADVISGETRNGKAPGCLT